MSKILIVSEMVVRDLARRRSALALLFLVPLAFYLARHGQTGQAVRFAGLGLAWGASTAGLFSANSAKSIEPRLRLGGFSWAHLFVGRIVALLLVSWGMAAAYLALISVDLSVPRLGGVAALLFLTALIAVPFGLLIGAVVPRDLEGTLVLIAVIGIQMVVDPAKGSTKYLPFWSSRELSTYAVDSVGRDYLARGLEHGLGVTAGLILVTATLTAVRLRRRRHLRPLAAVPS